MSLSCDFICCCQHRRPRHRCRRQQLIIFFHTCDFVYGVPAFMSVCVCVLQHITYSANPFALISLDPQFNFSACDMHLSYLCCVCSVRVGMNVLCSCVSAWMIVTAVLLFQSFCSICFSKQIEMARSNEQTSFLCDVCYFSCFPPSFFALLNCLFEK